MIKEKIYTQGANITTHLIAYVYVTETAKCVGCEKTHSLARPMLIHLVPQTTFTIHTTTSFQNSYFTPHWTSSELEMALGFMVRSESGHEICG